MLTDFTFFFLLMQMLFCFQTTVRFLAFKTKSTHSIVWNDCFSLKEWGNWEFNLISTKLISVFRVRYCMVLVFKCLKILFSMTPLLLETSYVFILHASVLSVNFFCKLKCRVFFLSFFFFLFLEIMYESWKKITKVLPLT